MEPVYSFSFKLEIEREQCSSGVGPFRLVEGFFSGGRISAALRICGAGLRSRL